MRFIMLGCGYGFLLAAAVAFFGDAPIWVPRLLSDTALGIALTGLIRNELRGR